MSVEHASKSGVGGDVLPGSVGPPTGTETGRVSQGDAELAATIVELAPDGILIVDPDGAISYANTAAAALFGYPRHHFTGIPMQVLVPDGAARIQAVQDPDLGVCGSPGLPGERVRDLTGRRADGSAVAVEMSLSPAHLGGRPATIVVLHQVDDDRVNERELFRRLIIEEDERIASDLNDRVVKRLFLAGMKIQSVLQLTDHPVTQRLSETVDQLDTVIREIRHTVFAGSLPATDDVANPLGA